MKIRIGIVGYGNLGKGVENVISYNEDMELVGVFTRRDPSTIKTKTNIPAYTLEDAQKMKDDIDVMILCGGSAKDLPEQTPLFAKSFNVVDSFDTHANIPEHFKHVDDACRASNHVGIVSVGWDPGLFSLQRLYGEAILPQGKVQTFWGKGVSQGHSDAIRRVEGVKDARQYTIPIQETLDKVRSGDNSEFTAREKHLRECYVVVEDGADKKVIEETIKTMPNYFADYETIVHFISEEELQKDHQGLPHGGVVLHTANTGFDNEHKQVIEYKLDLDSNPEFTSSVLVAYARAAYRLANEKQFGCKSVFEVAPAYLHASSVEELRKKLL